MSDKALWKLLCSLSLHSKVLDLMEAPYTDTCRCVSADGVLFELRNWRVKKLHAVGRSLYPCLSIDTEGIWPFQSLHPGVQVFPWDGTGLLVYYVPPCIQTRWTPEPSLCESRTARHPTRYIVVVRCSRLRACWSISVEHSARSSQEPQSDSYNFHAPS